MAKEVKRVCTICGTLHSYRKQTCSDECHEKLIERVVQEVGEEKVIVDAATGIEHLVPTREILKNGLKQEDLKYYPEKE